MESYRSTFMCFFFFCGGSCIQMLSYFPQHREGQPLKEPLEPHVLQLGSSVAAWRVCLLSRQAPSSELGCLAVSRGFPRQSQPAQDCNLSQRAPWSLPGHVPWGCSSVLTP